MSCKYQEICAELYDGAEGEEMRKACDPQTCDHWDAFFDGECLALEMDGE